MTEGALVGQSDATLLTTVDQLDPLYVNFSISASELVQLQNAQNVSLSGDGESTVNVLLADGTPYAETGKLDFSGTVVDPNTGAISLRATLPNPDKKLLPGSFVTLRATLGEQQNAFLVPQAAIQRDAAGAYALVVGKDGDVARKNVVTGDPRNGQWLITSGLAAGDQVIVSGLQKVKDGAPAKATPWKPAAGKPATVAKPE